MSVFMGSVQKSTLHFVKKDSNVFKIFYKTNIIDSWEMTAAKYCKLGEWKAYDIYSIYELFNDIETDNEVLGYYLEYIKKIYLSAKREAMPSEWSLISWHSFFNDYQSRTSGRRCGPRSGRPGTQRTPWRRWQRCPR